MRRRPVDGLVGVTLMLIGLAAGCGSSVASPDARAGGSGGSGTGGGGSGDSGSGDSGPADSGSGGGASGCGTVANAGPTVTLTAVPQPPAAAAGGALVSGTYFLTSFTYASNGSSCPATRAQAAIRISASSDADGAIEEVSSTDVASTGLHVTDARFTWTYHATANALALTFGCTGAVSSFTRNAATPVSFTATAADIRTYGPNGACGPTLSVFTRQ